MPDTRTAISLQDPHQDVLSPSAAGYGTRRLGCSAVVTSYVSTMSLSGYGMERDQRSLAVSGLAKQASYPMCQHIRLGVVSDE